ncbi:UNVERIFIED_CONTAM: hypothetical protein FKN15_078038 [Acipenser sinensis]
MLRLGLTIKDANSQLILVQSTVYLRLQLDSLTMRAYMSDDRVAAIRNCLALFNKDSQYNWCCVKNYWLHPKHDRHHRPPRGVWAGRGVSGSWTDGQENLIFEPLPAAAGPALGDPTAQGSPQSDARHPLAPRTGQTPAVGMAPEQDRLSALGLSDAVVSTLQNYRASSTRALYAYKWRYFQSGVWPKVMTPSTAP